MHFAEKKEQNHASVDKISTFTTLSYAGNQAVNTGVGTPTANATDAVCLCSPLMYIAFSRLVFRVGVGIAGVGLLLIGTTLLVF